MLVALDVFLPLLPSLVFLRLALRFEESLGAWFGDVSPDVPEEGLSESAMGSISASACAYPALDIAAAALFRCLLLPCSGASGTSGSTGSPFGLLVLRLSFWVGGDASAGALRLREAEVRRVGGDAVSVVDGGDAWVVVRSALSLAEARVTLCDMGK